MNQLKTPHIKNKIVKILPWYGEYHAYFQLYLHSIHRNKDCLDLLLVAEKPPDYPLPSNVIFLQKSLQEIDELLKHTIHSLFGLDLLTALPVYAGNIRKTAWKLCDYKPLFAALFSEHIKNYSHWAFGDCDTVFGSIKKHIPDFADYDFIVGKGHFSVIRNNDAWSRGVIAPNLWKTSSGYALNRFNGFVEKLKEVERCYILDESWFLPDLKIYAKNHTEVVRLLDIQTDGIYCHNHLDADNKPDGSFNVMHCGKHIHPEAKDNYYVYEDGELYRCSETFNLRESCLYTHFMGRTKLAQNKVIVEDFEKPLNFTINSPLIFS